MVNIQLDNYIIQWIDQLDNLLSSKYYVYSIELKHMLNKTMAFFIFVIDI